MAQSSIRIFRISTQPFCRKSLMWNLTSIGRLIAACSFAFTAFAPSTQAAPNKAEIDSFARGNGFPSSDYPYYENVNGCGGNGWSETAVRDTWGRVSFREACNNHDRCYMTPGSDVNQCDNKFGFDLRVSCERDSYVRDPVFNKKIPDPVTLSACYPIATTYFGSVRAVGWNWHQAAQAKARRYRDLVQSISTPSIIGERFDKPGNNGSVSCATFCGAVRANDQPVWGDKAGINVGSNQPLGASGVCSCAQSPDFFVKKGNNGTVTCNTYCRGAQWGRVGTCVASFDNKNGTGRDGNYLPGFLNGPELTCSCAK
jgi:hypothetical protein